MDGRPATPRCDGSERLRAPDELAGRDSEAIGERRSTRGQPVDSENVDAFRDRVLPNGCFVAAERAIDAVVGTCSATHNTDAGVHYFPFGGEIASLVVARAHRREGLGRALTAASTRRLLDGGYDSVRVGVDPERTAALSLFLAAGYAPCLVSDGDVGRWRDVFDELGVPFDRQRCIQTS